MIGIILIIVGLAVLVILIIALSDDEVNDKNDEKDEIDIKDEEEREAEKEKQMRAIAEEIASEVKTYAQFKNLEKRYDRAEEKSRNYHFKTESGEDNHEIKCTILGDAWEIARNKELRFQYVPNGYDEETPLKVLKEMFKVIPIEKYNIIKDSQDFKEIDWVGLDSICDPEEPFDKERFSFYKKFRKIVEDDKLNKEMKVRKINNLVKRNKEFTDEIFDLDSDMSAGDQWFE